MGFAGLQFAPLVGVFIGGAAGTAARIGCDRAFAVASWPAGTFVVNVVGALALGVLTARSHHRDHPLRLAVTVGFLGAFTTYSALAAQTLTIASESAFGATVYGAGSVAVGVVAAVGGLWIGARRKLQ